MKRPKQILTSLVLVFVSMYHLCAQNIFENVYPDPAKTYMIIKNDRTQFIGVVLSVDAREILIRTENMGDVYVPKHEISEIRELLPKEVKRGDFVGEEIFATRYFLTTNGLTIRKRESYVQWNLFGPDFQFGVADNLGIGIMTSWVGMPIVGTAKYSIDLPGKASLGLGTLLGTGSWAQPDFGLALPFAALTYGDRKNNIAFSAGYGAVFYSEEDYNPNTGRSTKEKFSEGRLLFAVAGIVKVGSVISLVFDSFIMPLGPYKEYTTWEYNSFTGNYYTVVTKKRTPALVVLVPGIRWQIDSHQAFQFGFTGLNYDGEFVPVPIPMIQWYRRLKM